MLKQLGYGAETMDAFISQVIPKDVMAPPEKTIQPGKLTEAQAVESFAGMASRNPPQTYLLGEGYYPVQTPAVIKRNVLENPGWYTSYTPYQAEVSQGRLQSLLNYQTMVSDLTGLPMSNASLLDEGTAAAEAMTMSLNHLPTSRAKLPDKVYVVSNGIKKSNIDVMTGRGEGFGIRVLVFNLDTSDAAEKLEALGDKLIGVMVQYPDNRGSVRDYQKLADACHKQGVLLSASTDLSALTVLKPPGEWGADIAFGNSQRFGIPMGYGGPHAAFMAVTEPIKRRLPGRLIGMSKDRLGRPALRLALQTREQHIRREKATSNVCTSQALLANMAAMYAIYHGPEQLRQMALNNMLHARMIGEAATFYGFKISTVSPDSKTPIVFDTVAIYFKNGHVGKTFAENLQATGIHAKAVHMVNNFEVRFAVPNDFNQKVFVRIVQLFQDASSLNAAERDIDVAARIWVEGHRQSSEDLLDSVPASVRRQSSFLTHPVFNSHHSETEMLRYIHHLQSKDLSLVHSMIPLGSCTMKLNGTTQMELIGNANFANVHPHASTAMMQGYSQLFKRLGESLAALTGMDRTCLQPNSGAQGEYAGLRAIRKYQETQPGAKRDICLIPVSAHGTNPASAAMAGMRVVPVKCDTATGNLDVEDLKAKCEKHADELGAIMVTYPSTYGVFEPQIREVCDIVHEHGGLVYMDGANMNAQIGLTSPGAIGADVCHLNLHKTFCIPHGGGGPGVGPICTKDFLFQYVPSQKGQHSVTSAPWGNASILPISWAYIATMGKYSPTPEYHDTNEITGDEGLRRATQIALLNANYILSRLKEHYPILHTNAQGRCAHEFIIDARPFQKTAGVEAIDIAKRLQDYGFHAPTMSWPVPNTLMVEPTESESKEELDRFIDAMISIRGEIRDIEEGAQPRVGNVLKNAPHPQKDIIIGEGDGKWERPYSREKAAYPLPYLVEKKFWPTVARVDDGEYPIPKSSANAC